MMVFRRLAVLGIGGLALIWPARPLLASLPVARLTAPADGAVLTSGSLAEVAWEEVAFPPYSEEWEAFLSVDGGRSYPLRITPHLDLRLRRFSFQVPPFPTQDARILLRFGDEKREEIEVDSPYRFAIELGDPPLLPLRLPTRGLGESARPGEAGVVAWVEGDRSGRGLHLIVGRGEAASLAAIETGTIFGVGTAAPLPSTPTLSYPTERRAPAPPAPLIRGTRSVRESDLPGSAVRLLIHRFNE